MTCHSDSRLNTGMRGFHNMDLLTIVVKPRASTLGCIAEPVSTTELLLRTSLLLQVKGTRHTYNGFRLTLTVM
jgi:hypothetical protein